jgi:hypothetical protein
MGLFMKWPYRLILTVVGAAATGFLLFWIICHATWILFPLPKGTDDVHRRVIYIYHLIAEKSFSLIIASAISFIVAKLYQPTWGQGLIAGISTAILFQVIAMSVYIFHFGLQHYQRNDDFSDTFLTTAGLGTLFGLLGVWRKYREESTLQMEEEEAFYLSFRHQYKLVVCYGLPLAAIVLILTEKGKPEWLIILGSLTITALVAIPLTRFVISAFPIKLNREGIWAHDAYCKFRFTSWQNIKAIKTFSLPGAFFLRIVTEKERSPLWLLLPLTGKRDFRAAITDFVPPDNPLAHYFVNERSS